MSARAEMMSGAAAHEQRCGDENTRTQPSYVIAMHAAPRVRAPPAPVTF
jgi:hypothetical protein